MHYLLIRIYDGTRDETTIRLKTYETKELAADMWKMLKAARQTDVMYGQGPNCLMVPAEVEFESRIIAV